MDNNFFNRAISPIRSLLYPAHCGACGCRIPEDVDGTLSQHICQVCVAAILRPKDPSCPVCSHPMEGSPHCTNCEGRTWHLSAIAAACRYEGLIRELIHRFKYGRDTTLAPLLGEILCGVTQDPRISGKQFDAIVPVPLHALREREREFNQAALLASFLSKRTSLPVKPLLKRFKNTPPQAGFDRALRMENLSGAFVLRGNVSVHASFLLVDDVTTTGSTLDACARLLREAGAAEVCAVSVARG